MFIRSRFRTGLGYPGVGSNGEAVAYYQAVESYRDERGRTRQRVLASWNDWSDGSTVADAIAMCDRKLREARKEVAHWRGFIAEADRIADDLERKGLALAAANVRRYIRSPQQSRHRNVIE